MNWRLGIRRHILRTNLFILSAGCLLGAGCASNYTESVKFSPADTTKTYNQEMDEADCRIKFDMYRSGINSNWLSGDFYNDCMLSKGYKRDL